MSALPSDFDVSAWLESLGLGDYAPTFAENELTPETLASLNDADLREIGVAVLGHRKRILQSIRELHGLPTVLPAEEVIAEEPVQEQAVEAAAEVDEEPTLHAPVPTLAESAPSFSPAPPSLLATSGPAVSHLGTAPAAVLGSSQSSVAPATSSKMSTRKKAGIAGLIATIMASKFLFVSIGAHLLFGLGATYYVVQKIQAKRQVAFQGGPPNVNPSKRALEHKVSMAEKKKTGGAPPQAKRIVTAGLSKVSLPEMPTINSATTVVPGMAAGMGGAGFGAGMGFGNGMGSGMGGGGGGGNGFNFFGMRMQAKSIVLVLDISGSMAMGKKNATTYERLEREVVRLINSLDGNAQFGLIAFSKDASTFRTKLVPAASGEKSAASSWFKRMSSADAIKKSGGKLADYEEGRHQGTRADKGLEAAFELKPDIIFFVSDGEPTGTTSAQIMKQVEAAQKNLPKPLIINSIAYMADSGQSFMKELAEQNGGRFREVN